MNLTEFSLTKSMYDDSFDVSAEMEVSPGGGTISVAGTVAIYASVCCVPPPLISLCLSVCFCLSP